MADKQHKNGEAGAPEPDEVTEVTQAAAPAEAEPAAAGESTVVMADASEETTQVAAGGDARPPRSRRRPGVPAACAGSSSASSSSSPVWRWWSRGLTLWTHYTVMNTDGYMNLVGPIGKDPEAIQNLSEYVGGQVIAATDLQQRVTDALPPRVQLLAGPITSYVEDFITKGANKVLSSPKAYDLWLEINRVGHEKIVALLRGETTNVYVAGSDVKLNLLPLISQVLVWVDERLPGGLSDRFSPPVIAPDTDPAAGIQEVANWSGKPLPSDFGQITLLQSDALGPAQTAVKWFDRLTWILPLVTVALIALTIWLSRRRARTAIALGIGAADRDLRHTRDRQARVALPDRQAGGGQGDHIVRDVVNASLGPLTTITVWICVIGVVAALLVWLLGRRDVRAGVVAAGKRVAGQSAEISLPDSPVTTWIVNHVVGVRWGVLIVGLIVLALVASSWLGIVLVIVVVLLLEGFLSFMTGQWPFHERESDEAPSV